MDTSAGLTLARPEALLLLLLLVPLVVYISRTSAALLRPSRRRWALALRLLLTGLIALALAGAGLETTADNLSVVFLLDRSDSIGGQAQAAQAGYVRSVVDALREGDSAGVVAFGADALVDRPVSGAKASPDLQSRPLTTYSNIEEAMRLGLAALPGGSARRMVLLSDGLENVGSAEWAARLAAANGVPIDVVPLSQPGAPEVWVDGMTAPPRVRDGERVQLSLDVFATVATTATLLILEDGVPLAQGGVTLATGSNTFTQSVEPPTKGFHTYTAVITASPGADALDANNRWSAFTMVEGKARLLVVEGHLGDAEALVPALSSSAVVDVVTPAQAPVDVRALAGYDGVVLVNVPAPALVSGVLGALQVAVRDLGKGLVVVGGDESYAAGGYFRTPLEEMLPVNLNLPSKLEIPAVAMVMVIDRSGSMEMGHTTAGSGIKKIEMAKEAASLAVAQLSERDYAGVVTFDSAANWAVPLQALGDPDSFKSRIGTITSGGGTDIYAGLLPAVEALEANGAKSKHILLLTDGVSAGGDYDALLKRMEGAKITLSTVAVGADADTSLMKALAAGGKGNYYYTEDGNTLPQIFAHESHVAARSYIIEHEFAPRRSFPTAILEGIGGLPALRGYVGTSQRDGGQVALVTDTGEPLLAQWQYGLGRVVAWTSDAKGQWARDWVEWTDFNRFWGQAVRWATGTEAGGVLQSHVEVTAGVGRITVDASTPAGAYLNGLDVQALVVAPSNVTSTTTLRQKAAGRYEGEFAASEEGAYLLRVQAREAGQANEATMGQTLGAVVPYSPEYRGSVRENGLLARLASITGGRVLSLDNVAAVLEHNIAGARTTRDLSPLLLVLAILLLPFDIGLRRVTVSRTDLARLAGAIRAALGRRQRRAVVGAGAASIELEALLGAKGRVRAVRDAERSSVALPRSEPAAPAPSSERAAPASRTDNGATRPHRASPPTRVEPTEQPDEALAARLRRARDSRR